MASRNRPSRPFSVRSHRHCYLPPNDPAAYPTSYPEAGWQEGRERYQRHRRRSWRMARTLNSAKTNYSVRAGDQGLAIERRLTREGVHPFDEIEWEIRHAL